MNEVEANQRKKSKTLKVGHSYVILSEIITIVNFGFRQWVGVLGFVFTLLLSLLTIFLILPNNPDLNFYLFGLTIFVGTILSLMLFQRTLEMTTTGGKKHLQSAYQAVVDDFISRVPEDQVLIYSKKTFLHTWQFVININRIVEYSWKNRMMYWPFLLAAVLLAAGGLSIATQIEVILSIIFFLLGAAFLNFGFLTARTIITLSGTGGQKINLYIDREDRKRILEKMRLNIEKL